MFDFELGQSVKLALSGEKGIISARAEYLHQTAPRYLVEYVDASGHQVENWFVGSSITAIED